MEGRLAKTLGVMIGAFTLALLPSIIILAIQPALTLYLATVDKISCLYQCMLYLNHQYFYWRFKKNIMPA